MTKHLDVDDHLLNLICIEYRWGVIVLTLCSVIDNERRYVKVFGTRENLHQQVQSCIMHTHIIFHNTEKKVLTAVLTIYRKITSSLLCHHSQ